MFTLPQDDLPAVARADGQGPLPSTRCQPRRAGALAQGELALIDNQINATTSTLR